tara:strand:+ start:544 stop:1572 length:1029 start_codon:yes stop_codon:yes gene_type:complete
MNISVYVSDLYKTICEDVSSSTKQVKYFLLTGLDYLKRVPHCKPGWSRRKYVRKNEQVGYPKFPSFLEWERIYGAFSISPFTYFSDEYEHGNRRQCFGVMERRKVGENEFFVISTIFKTKKSNNEDGLDGWGEFTARYTGAYLPSYCDIVIPQEKFFRLNEPVREKLLEEYNRRNECIDKCLLRFIPDDVVFHVKSFLVPSTPIDSRYMLVPSIYSSYRYVEPEYVGLVIDEDSIYPEYIYDREFEWPTRKDLYDIEFDEYQKVLNSPHTVVVPMGDVNMTFTNGIMKTEFILCYQVLDFVIDFDCEMMLEFQESKLIPWSQYCDDNNQCRIYRTEYDWPLR